ncbi:PREDICTED: uncharacterized protein LOC109330798 [Lupinus angustifolius]|uniref:uncharacterized protein LOC109330798 n=1 Tax=Lupinus angustifolius TaxID=3871 RepID=UPI00092F8634|nr:PREDICTED: uncharacterized protein LOC109330798 [Lupinus angustifolius]
MTYSSPSSFFRSTNSEGGRDVCHTSGIMNNNNNDLFIGMQFETKEATIHAIREFHIQNSFDYVVDESRPDRYVGKCTQFGAGCEWRIRASFNVKRDIWEIKKINETHTCVSMLVSQDHSKLNSSFIADVVINLVSADPSIPVKTLVKEVVSRFGYTVTYRNAWTAKQMALAKKFGDWEGSYNDLPRWMNVVQYFSPGTIVKYEARHNIRDGMEDYGRFTLDRVFWAFKPCIDGFAYCKPIIQVDGTFLTEKYTGTLLIASSQDRNRRVFPVAYTTLGIWFSTILSSYYAVHKHFC